MADPAATMLAELYEAGRLRMPTDQELLWSAECDQVLCAADVRAREHWPGPCPELDLAAARYGALRFLAGARAHLMRTVSESTLAKQFSGPKPRPTPQVIHSVDLTLRMLPRLLAMVERHAPTDPLVQHLRDLARDWPLSSIGCSELGSVDLGAILQHPGLRRRYVDRVLARHDDTRIPAVAGDILAVLGNHPELAPWLDRVALAGHTANGPA